MTSPRRYIRHTRQRYTYAAVFLSVGFFALYLCLISVSVHHVVARKALIADISELNTEISALESELIVLESEIRHRLNSHANLAFTDQKVYLERSTTLAATSE